MALAQSRSRLNIRLLGEPQFLRDGAAVHIALPQKALLLLCILALKAGEPVDRSKAAFTIWPDDLEDEARAKLRRHLHVLSRALTEPGEPSQVRTEGSNLQWKIDGPCAIDVIEFQRLIATGDREGAAALYSGDLLTNFYEDWLEAPRRRLRELQLGNLLALADYAARQGDYGSVIEYARSALRIDPWREDALRHVLIARTESGDRSGAMHEFATFAARLREEFDAEPAPETKRTVEAIKHAQKRLTNLPHETSRFIGRVAELASIGELLKLSRVVTITGPGGVGKTRTAICAARSVIDDYPGGVWIVTVGPQSSHDELLDATAVAVGLANVPQSEKSAALIAHLRQTATLLLFDNAEGSLEPCARFCEQFTSQCDALTVLVTSREPLGILAERAFRLAPFEDDDHAVELFYDRARAADASFDPHEQQRSCIAEICRRLDRLPLATELAAARITTLTPADLLARLDNRFALLKRMRAPAVQHHQTLRATIDWSYGLLASNEQALFQRCAFFAAPFTLESLETVAADDVAPRADLLDLLGRLVDKSLITAGSDTATRRYAMLDSLREFGREKLADSGAMPELRRRYVAYYASVAARCRAQLEGAGQQEALQLLSDELPNIRLALNASQDDPSLAPSVLDIACDLQQFWLMRSLFSEGAQSIKRALDGCEWTEPEVRARALSFMALLACFSEDRATAIRLEEQALALRRESNDGAGIGQSLHDLANYAFEAGEVRRAYELFSEALQRARDAGDEALEAKALDNVGLTATALEAFSEARDALEASLRIYERRRDDYGIAWVLGHLGWLCERTGQHQDGAAFQTRSLRLRESIGDLHGIALSAHGLARSCDALADHVRAAELRRRSLRIWSQLHRPLWLLNALEAVACADIASRAYERGAVLFSAIDALRRARSYPLPPYERARHESASRILERKVAPEQLQTYMERGALLSLEETVEFALNQDFTTLPNLDPIATG